MFWDNLECKHLCFLLTDQIGVFFTAVPITRNAFEQNDGMFLGTEDRGFCVLVAATLSCRSKVLRFLLILLFQDV